MRLPDCAINWDALAILKDNTLPATGLAWMRKTIYDGSVAGAVRFFKDLPPEQQKRIEMLTEPGVIEHTAAGIAPTAP
jgi:hypothetical protein